MDEQAQERARWALAAQLREGWAGPEAQKKLNCPPRWEWPFNGHQTFRLISLIVVISFLVPTIILVVRVADDFNALGTVKSFCAAESLGDFTTAYNLLSRHVRSELTQDQVTARLQLAHIADCSTADSIYETMLRLGKNGDQIQRDMTYSVTGIGAISGTLSYGIHLGSCTVLSHKVP